MDVLGAADMDAFEVEKQGVAVGVVGEAVGEIEVQHGTLEVHEFRREDIKSHRSGRGEIQQMGPDFPMTELWKVVVGAKPGRSEKKQTTVLDSVGFAIEDFSALRRVRQRLAGADFHEELDLVADPDDPRDLYGMLMRAA